jgi:hypothetical protein
MTNWMQEREAKLREYFGLSGEANWLGPEHVAPELTPAQERHLARYNLEWHIVPPAQALPLDEAYFDRMYPTRSRDFAQETHHSPDFTRRLREGHSRQQGRVVAVESTRKPGYRPGNVQYYGTYYGFDASTDPFVAYMGRANFHSGTRFDHNYASLRAMITLINQDWRAHGLMPEGYRLTICPPALWNLIGNVFHPEWSETDALEMGFYRDEHDNAHCYALGSNQPGDFSYIRAIEAGSGWTLLGFRTALLPEREPSN